MPIVEGLDLPIERTVVAGSIVDRHRSRREHDDAEALTAADLLASYTLVREHNIAALQALAQVDH